jgi:hypothetical protein
MVAPRIEILKFGPAVFRFNRNCGPFGFSPRRGANNLFQISDISTLLTVVETPVKG